MVSPCDYGEHQSLEIAITDKNVLLFITVSAIL